MRKNDEGKRPKRKPRANAPEKSDELPVDYMLRVMRDPKAPASRRDKMAKSVTSYVHAKPASKKSKQDGDASLKRRLETARETLARKIAGLRSDAD